MTVEAFLPNLKAGKIAEMVLIRPETTQEEPNSSSGLDEGVLEDLNKQRQTRVGSEILKNPNDPESSGQVLWARDVEANSEEMSWTVQISSRGDEGEARAKYGVDELSFEDVVNAAMSSPGACIIQSATVASASADLNAESDSDVATACRQDVSYTGDECAFREVSSAVLVNSADQHSDATKYYDGREVLLLEGIKPNDDPATADSALETLDAENGLDTVTEPVPAELSWEDDEYSSTRGPMESLELRYLAIAATEDEQEGDVDNSKTDIFERSGTDLKLTDYALELACGAY
ncbi:hypothetical protein PInf_013695 [Phytophthora infestans]|nr:hypothetical protein PInf_013695 [Phytophthora infestans]